MNSRENNPFLNVTDSAEHLCLKKRTLDNMRWMGTGPMFRKHGGRIYYHFKELNRWSDASCATSTSQY